MSEMHSMVVLHNIRSAHNVGAILRTCDAIGLERVFLTGYTPRPLDRFGRPDPRITKTALGAEKTLCFEYRKDPMPLLEHLRKDGYTIVGAEQDARACDYKTFTSPERTVLLVGNEVRGLSPALRKKCDTLIEIPMHGKKESLNVAVSFGIIAYRLWDK